ncbi:SLC13 family permease [Pelagibacterium lacus]|uniref:Cation transporter n=1 Tax=Pelagibacterium lacus TaxID=2282655 RepID=A0A369W5P7_9HYPH|nr:SLC13 family permease [Pelagibacterium lacus]RDE08582.1 cation transporter [Pelagibacterium lacus]
MSFDQIGILGLLAAMMVGFATVRRFEIVALAGLALGGLLGLVPAADLFAGFASPSVITVIEILLIVDVLKRSVVLDALAERLGGALSSERGVILGLCAVAAIMSSVMNNIGALALVLPLAISLAERYGIAPERMLMPLSFATLLGGLCSVIGTPANLLGAAAIESALGDSFGFFEIALVGLPLTLAGLAYLWVVLPRQALGSPAEPDATPDSRNFLTEIELTAFSPLVGGTREAAAVRFGVTIHNVVRRDAFLFGRDKPLEAGDIVIVEGERAAITALSGHDEQPLDLVEAVVMPESIYIGSAVDDLVAFAQAGVSIIELGITPRRVEGRLANVKLSVGDIIVMRGDKARIAQECAESGLLQLAPARRDPAQPTYFPLIAFGMGIAASAFAGIDPAVAFGLVVVVLALTGHLSLRQGFEGLNWSILIMLGAMIPLGQAVAGTRAAEALATTMTGFIPEMNTVGLTAIMLAFSVLLTPFVNNPTTVLVLAPIAVALSGQYGLPATPALVAVIVGASLDFLTPFGHHNNTLVMGIAGYRFGDYARLGWPLVLICSLIAIFLIPALF